MCFEKRRLSLRPSRYLRGQKFFERSHGKQEKLVTAKFAKNSRQGRKEKYPNSGGMEPNIGGRGLKARPDTSKGKSSFSPIVGSGNPTFTLQRTRGAGRATPRLSKPEQSEQPNRLGLLDCRNFPQCLHHLLRHAPVDMDDGHRLPSGNLLLRTAVPRLSPQ